MHRMMVIQVSDSSDDAALAKVMAGPTESAVAFTSTGNMEQARSATSAIMDADWARNAFRVVPGRLAHDERGQQPHHHKRREQPPQDAQVRIHLGPDKDEGVHGHHGEQAQAQHLAGQAADERRGP